MQQHNSNYAPNKSYGSFDKTKVELETNKVNNLEHISPSSDSTIDNDSGMSSGENDDSVRYSYINNVSSSVADEEVKKCLSNEIQSAVHWNEIPSCSNVNNENNIEGKFRTNVNDFNDENDHLVDSEFIVINLSCEVSDVCDSRIKESVVGTNAYDLNYDNASVISVESSQSLVPAANKEIVKSESQKLVSLSLSILLAALLQAMRCFAQFLEDIVTPQRL